MQFIPYFNHISNTNPNPIPNSHTVWTSAPSD